MMVQKVSWQVNQAQVSKYIHNLYLIRFIVLLLMLNVPMMCTPLVVTKTVSIYCFNFVELPETMCSALPFPLLQCFWSWLKTMMCRSAGMFTALGASSILHLPTNVFKNCCNKTTHQLLSNGERMHIAKKVLSVFSAELIANGAMLVLFGMDAAWTCWADKPFEFAKNTTRCLLIVAMWGGSAWRWQWQSISVSLTIRLWYYPSPVTVPYPCTLLGSSFCSSHHGVQMWKLQLKKTGTILI